METKPMTGSSRHRRAAALLALCLLATPFLGAEEARFRPQDCFPADSLLYLEVRSVEGLGEALRLTLYGRIATHPGVRAALGTLPQLARAEIERTTAGFTQAVG